MADPKKDDPKARPPASATGTPDHPATAMKPSDTQPPDAKPFVDAPDAGGRPNAREGLKPQGNEVPHPSAAARPGKSSGMAGFAPVAEFSDDDDPADLTEAEAGRREVAEARAKRTNPIQVEATALGYYDNTRRRPGEVFVIYHESEFSREWMRRTDGRKRPSPPKTGNQALQEQHRDMKAGVKSTHVDDNPLNA